MSKEDLYKYYRRKTKDEIIEELLYKCNANYDLVKRIDKAIEVYEQCIKTQDFSTCDLEMYEILKGSDSNGYNKE